MTTWLARQDPKGLALHGPTGHLFARGIAEIPAAWTTASMVHRAIVAYGISPGMITNPSSPYGLDGSLGRDATEVSPPHGCRCSAAEDVRASHTRLTM
ncbi:hypothetical protein [Micromonospora sp. NPDC007230]|uniref:hypothetical protein n=1 Tax=Micromonospora sp. NPDC007230 TaxID=3364237 RepID=UPI003687DF21